jgi:hypothetical protein
MAVGDSMTINIPAGCGNGYQPWVYFRGAQATFKVEFTTKNGSSLGFPKFEKEVDGSSPDCDRSQNTCEFKGTISYVHQHGGEDVRLKLTKIQ